MLWVLINTEWQKNSSIIDKCLPKQMDNGAASQDELLSGPQGQSQKIHFKN